MIKKLTTPNGQFNAAYVKAINGDGSVSVDLLVLNEEGAEVYREPNYGIPAPWPFRLTAAEKAALSPPVVSAEPETV